MHALIAAIALIVAAQVTAQPFEKRKETQKSENLEIVDMGSFRIGSRTVDITGNPVRDVRFSPTSVPFKLDPNGRYVVEQMYVQYFIPKTKRAQLPLLLWHGGG